MRWVLPSWTCAVTFHLRTSAHMHMHRRPDKDTHTECTESVLERQGQPLGDFDRTDLGWQHILSACRPHVAASCECSAQSITECNCQCRDSMPLPFKAPQWSGGPFVTARACPAHKARMLSCTSIFPWECCRAPPSIVHSRKCWACVCRSSHQLP